MTFTTTTTETPQSLQDKEENKEKQTQSTGEISVEKTLPFISLLSEADKTKDAEQMLQDMVGKLMDLEKNKPSEYTTLIRETSIGLI